MFAFAKFCEQSGLSDSTATVDHKKRSDRIFIGGSNSLPAFTLDGKVGQLDSLRVTDFFDMLSRNVSSASKAAAESGGPEFTRNWN